MKAGVPAFLRDRVPSLLLFGGKGGVGKTTCATAAALTVARLHPEGSYLLVSTDPAHSLADSMAGSTLPPNLRLLELDASERLVTFKSAHGAKLKQIASRGTFLEDEDISQFLDLSLPGLDELMAFLEIAALVEREAFDSVIVDTAPWGHTLRLLEMPDLIGRWLQALDALLAKHRHMKKVFSGAYHRDELDGFLLELKAAVDRMQDTLRDPLRCCFVPVTLAEALSVSETVGLVAQLRRLKVPVTLMLVNRLFPKGGCAACAAGRARQMCEVERIVTRMPDLVVWGIRLYPQEVRGVERLAAFWEGAAELTKTPLTNAEKTGGEPTRFAEPRVDYPAPLPSPRTTLLIFAGKGGVGKTTLACATALRLARERPDMEIMLCSMDPAHSLSACTGTPVGPTPTRLGPRLTAMEIDAHADLEALKRRYARELERTLAAFLPDLDLTFDCEVMERILDLAPPGLDEMMALARAMEFLAGGTYQVFVLDAAPTGHLIRLLEMPELVGRWLNVFFGLFLKYKSVLRLPDVSESLVKLSKNLKRFRALLRDPARASVCVVSIPTEMACDETGDLLAACGRIQVSAPVLFVNLATPASGCALCSALRGCEARVQRKFRDMFPAIHQTLVYRHGEPRGIDRLGELGRALYRDERES